MRPFPIAALLLLAACNSLEPLVSPPIMDNAECRAQSLRDPEVRNTARELNPENQTNVRRVETERNEALRRVYNNCLRERGLPTQGGVEAIQRTF
jgi:hypothetical protein